MEEGAANFREKVIGELRKSLIVSTMEPKGSINLALFVSRTVKAPRPAIEALHLAPGRQLFFCTFAPGWAHDPVRDEDSGPAQLCNETGRPLRQES